MIAYGTVYSSHTMPTLPDHDRLVLAASHQLVGQRGFGRSQ